MALSQAGSARAATFVAIDVPGAQSTSANCINTAGAVAGFYYDANFASHGYVRSPSGTITTFDAPGAGVSSSQGTFSSGINAAGVIVGSYVDANLASHGFLRSASGTLMTFDVPGAGAGLNQGTFSGGINYAGIVVGYYVDAHNTTHGFVRGIITGAFQRFDVPGASATWAIAVNDHSEMAGYYYDGEGVLHGYLRSASGVFTTVDAPAAGTATGQGTVVNSLNNQGAVTGSYIDTASLFHAFVRNAAGDFTDISIPACQSTEGFGINAAGIAVGSCSAAGVTKGFVRSPKGAVVEFAASGGQGSGIAFTQPLAINQAGAIAGWFQDSLFESSGFLLLP